MQSEGDRDQVKKEKFSQAQFPRERDTRCIIQWILAIYLHYYIHIISI